jgi:SAM-dependent methyltransferase
MTIWEHFGERDPYYGVLTSPEFRLQNLDAAAKERFFASGRDDIERFIGLVTKHFGAPTFGTALDYGCGVGRLSLALSDRFERVISIDISKSMIERARATLADRNVQFELANETTDEPADLIISYIVIQHIEPSVGMDILAKLAKRARGKGVIHFPIRYRGGFLRGTVSSIRKAIWPLLPGVEPIIPMYPYDLERVLGIFKAAGLRTTVEYDHSDRYDFATMVFSR